MIEISSLHSYLQTFTNLSFRTSATTNIDYIDVLFVFTARCYEVFLNDMRYINPRFTYLLTY